MPVRVRVRGWGCAGLLASAPLLQQQWAPQSADLQGLSQTACKHIPWHSCAEAPQSPASTPSSASKLSLVRWGRCQRAPEKQVQQEAPSPPPLVYRALAPSKGGEMQQECGLLLGGGVQQAECRALLTSASYPHCRHVKEDGLLFQKLPRKLAEARPPARMASLALLCMASARSGQKEERDMGT